MVSCEQAMIPCSEAQAEAQPVVLPFSIEMDAPVEVSTAMPCWPLLQGSQSLGHRSHAAVQG